MKNSRNWLKCWQNDGKTMQGFRQVCPCNVSVDLYNGFFVIQCIRVMHRVTKKNDISHLL